MKQDHWGGQRGAEKREDEEKCQNPAGLKKSEVIKTTQNSSLLQIYQIFNTENP